MMLTLGQTVACFGLVAGVVVIFLANLLPDDVGIQSFTILGGLIFAFSFPLAPLFVKLGLIGCIVITWPWFGDRLSGFLFRHLKR